MNYSAEDYEKYELEKITKGEMTPAMYFRRAIGIQNTAYEEGYADRRFEQSCHVLAHTGLCNEMGGCANCKLNGAHDIAVREIAAGLREKNDICERRTRRKNEKSIAYHIPGYDVKIVIDDEKETTTIKLVKTHEVDL